MHSNNAPSRLKAVYEFFSLLAPIICLFDCIVLPAASAILPLAGMHHIIHGVSDQVISLLVLGICAPVILPGFYKHRSKRVLFLFGSGISLMFFVNFAGLQLDYAVHTVTAILISYLLIRANLENKKLLSCSCSAHKHSDTRQPVGASHH